MDKKTHAIISAVIAVAFVVVVQLFATPQPLFRFLLPAFVIYMGGVGIYNWYYLKRNESLKFWLWLRFPLLLLSWFGVYFLISDAWPRSLFLVATLPVLYFFESLIGNTGQQLGLNEFLLTLGTLLLALFGLSYYFILPGLFFLALVLFAVTITVRSSLELVPHDTAVQWVVAVAIGFFAAQLFWVMGFWPLHYTVSAVITFVALYVGWMLYYHYLYHTLTNKQIQFYLFFASVLILIALLTTTWSIQS